MQSHTPCTLPHTPWSFCSSFLTHHFLMVFQGLSFLCESLYMNNNYQTPCCNIHLHCHIWDISTFSYLILNQIFPLLKSSKHVIFISNAIKPSFSCCLINKKQHNNKRYQDIVPELVPIHLYAQDLTFNSSFVSQPWEICLSYVFH